MTGLLASVRNRDEALQVLAAGVDIIDLKQPTQGALGALDPSAVEDIVETIDRRLPVSATIGDLPMQADLVFNATQTMAATGVDYVKIGFFPGGDWPSTINRLARLCQLDQRLIAVLFADNRPDLQWLKLLTDAGFTGVMLDTMDKSLGSLTQLMALDEIRRFVGQAHELHLICGVAGSLTAADIEPLLSLRPDYLGFRGALCKAHRRTAHLDPEAIAAIRQNMSQSSYFTKESNHVQEIIDHH